MYLTQTAEYALRAMAHVASLGKGQAQRAQDMALATGIPLPYLSKILRRLVVAGLLVSQKGHHGGFVLARPARDIRFADILAAADYNPNPEACAFGWENCDPVHPCPLHPAWAQLKTSYSDWAASTTLAQVVPAQAGARLSRRAEPARSAARPQSKSATPARRRAARGK